MKNLLNNVCKYLVALAAVGMVSPQTSWAGGSSHGGHHGSSNKMNMSSNSNQGQSKHNHFSKVIAAPNGNTGINGTGLPKRWQKSQVIAAPNGIVGITGAGLRAKSVASQAHGELRGLTYARRPTAASPTVNGVVIVGAPTTGVRGSVSNAAALKKPFTTGVRITRAANPMLRSSKISSSDGDGQSLDFERQQLSALLRKLEQDMSNYSSESAKLGDIWRKPIGN